MTIPKTVKKKRKATKKNEGVAVMEKETLSPLRELFISYFLDPLSPSFGKVMPSAIKAGFAESYARNLTVENPRWLQEILGKHKFGEKARRNLNKHLDLKTAKQTKYGEFEDAHLLEIQQKATFFVLEKLDPDFVKKDKEPKGGDTILNKLEFHIEFPEGFTIPENRTMVESVVVEKRQIEDIEEQPETYAPKNMIIAPQRKRFSQGQQMIDDINLQIPEDTRFVDERKVDKSKNAKKMLSEVLGD